MNREQARRLALALPEAVEQDDHGRPSLRVADTWEGKAPKRLLRHADANTSLPQAPGSGDPA